MLYNQVEESVKYIRSVTDKQPEIGIVLGSGLGALVDIMEDKAVIAYKDIPNFPQSSVAGHAGNLVIGKVHGQTVAAMQGRFHFYEGFSMQEVTYPMYVMKLLGVKNMIITNACGAINKSFAPGDLMILTDYLNLIGIKPLTGPNDERFGPRFPDVSEAYDKGLIGKAEAVAKKYQIAYQKGVYNYFPGPCYETAAEIRAMGLLGADAVGMSTVPETIVAHYLGMKVLGIACITNMATGIAKEKHTHEAVVKVANEASETLCGWIEKLFAEWES